MSSSKDKKIFLNKPDDHLKNDFFYWPMDKRKKKWN